jgi:hypothetical protein
MITTHIPGAIKALLPSTFGNCFKGSVILFNCIVNVMNPKDLYPLVKFGINSSIPSNYNTTKTFNSQ